MTLSAAGLIAADQLPDGEAAVSPRFDVIELLFFAYRDFVGDADRILEAYGFGRAHHRVLHFVSRRPGLTVAELLDVLKITKQSLNRVMKDLLDSGLVDARAGVSDRRQRMLFATARGKALALELAGVQSERIRKALDTVPAASGADIITFLLALVNEPERAKVSAMVWPERAASERPSRP